MIPGCDPARSTRHRSRQRELLLQFLRDHSDRALTAADCTAGLRDQLGEQQAPGQSTVYRLLNQLSSDGIVKRLPRAGAMPQRYQMDGHQDCHGSLHLKCQGCGSLDHLDDELEGQLSREIAALLHFEIDAAQTTLYGLCAACQGLEARDD